jgi:hypothetical protein
MSAACDASAEGPAELRAPGLTLGGKETKLVTFPKAGSYHLTAAAAGAGADAVVTVVEPAEDTGPDLPN